MIRQVLVFAAFLVALGLFYTGYKAFGQGVDDAQTSWPVLGSVLPRTDDLNMPPLNDILATLVETPRGEDRLFAVMMLGDDRNIQATHLMGRRQYSRAA